MKEHGNVLGKNADGRVSELVVTLIQGVFRALKLIDEQQLEMLAHNKGEVVATIVDSLLSLLKRMPQSEKWLRREWEIFYQKVFGLRINLSKVPIPSVPDLSNYWLVIVDPFIRIDAIHVIQRIFSVWDSRGNLADGRILYDLDEPETEEAGRQPYAIWVRNTINPDVERVTGVMRYLDSVPQLTLLERLLLGAFVFRKTGNHLDTQRPTVCAGSRTPNGSIPIVNSVHQNGCDGIKIRYCTPEELGSTSVISIREVIR